MTVYKSLKTIMYTTSISIAVLAAVLFATPIYINDTSGMKQASQVQQEKKAEEKLKPKTLEKKVDSIYEISPFDQGKKQIEAKGYEIISLEENALLRIKERENAESSVYGNYTREGIVYVPRKGVYLTKNSPIMQNAEEATQCHRKGKEYYLTSKQVKEALRNSVRIENSSIPTDKFKENPITKFAFGRYAEQYGNFLRKAGFNEMPIILAPIQNKPFARQMWFSRITCDCASILYGYLSLNDTGSRVRGIKQSAKQLQTTGTKK